VQFRRPTQSQVSIDIAPLVDVVFLLVIFFAVSTTFLESSGLKLELPSSSATAERQPSELTVFLAADGTLSFDGEIVELAQLGGLLRPALDEAEQKLVVLRADRDTRHGEVVAVIDVIRDAGAVSMTMGTKPTTSPR
jgi:biopolymer transport protein ExbD